MVELLERVLYNLSFRSKKRKV